MRMTRVYAALGIVSLNGATATTPHI
jgi:hypothetical protein